MPLPESSSVIIWNSWNKGREFTVGRLFDGDYKDEAERYTGGIFRFASQEVPFAVDNTIGKRLPFLTTQPQADKDLVRTEL